MLKRRGQNNPLIDLAMVRPWWVIAIWLAAVLASTALIVGRGGSAFSTSMQRYDQSDSTRADTLVRQRFPDRSGSEQPNEILVVHSASLKVDDRAFREQAETIAERLIKLDDKVLAWAVSYFLTGDEALVSSDRHTTLVPMLIRDPEHNITLIRQALAIRLPQSDLQLYLVGRASVGSEFKALAEEDLKAELRLGLPAAIVVLLFVSATAVAALVPLIIATASILVSLAITVLAGPAVDAYFLVTNMVVMMGLAVGVDYSLFVLSRFREERDAGHEPQQALALAGSTAGRAILYSGATVMLALLGLLIIPTNVYRSLAAGAILAVSVCLLAAFTLLPAIVALLGDRLNAFRLPFSGIVADARLWERLTRVATGRPVLCLLLTVSLLLGLALPALDIRTGFSGIESLPAQSPSKRGFEILEREFRTGTISEAVVVIDGTSTAPDLRQAVARLQTALTTDKAFLADKARLQGNAAGNLSVLTIPMAGDAESPSAQAGVRRLRDQHIVKAFEGVPATALVSGNAAAYIDFFRLTDHYTPVVIGFVLSLSFVLLTVAFRSVIVPLKAIILNLLSVGAAYGLMVLVFQQGVGASLLGFQQVALIEAWIPLFLFTILYGFSMDYHVFLLSRVREQFEITGNNEQAIRFGVRSTSGVITGAALIMVAIFAGFASGQLVMFQQVGFGLAVAVLLDATVVRSVLVPAAMTLLGERNWYLPRWLAWLPGARRN